MYRSWQQRRAAWTATTLFFCNVGDSAILDNIPLAEIDKIAGSKFASPLAENANGNVMTELLRRCLSKTNKHASTLQSPSEKISIENTTFFIRTRPGGANAGRAYSLRVCRQRYRDIIVALRQTSKLARMAAEPKSRCQILQESVRQKIDSEQFQFVAAALIFMVGHSHFLQLIVRIFKPTHLSLSQNFALNIAESQLNQRLFDENGSANLAGSIFDKLEILFTCIFTVEVLLKAFAYWCRCDSCEHRRAMSVHGPG
jgi:hypothetical protein